MTSEQQPIRIVTIDDHELLRGGIRFSLLPVDDIELVGEAGDGDEAIEVCKRAIPDVVLLDMHLPGEMDGTSVAKAIRIQFPDTQVIVLSSYYDPELVQDAMQAGAIGYLVKGVSGEVMADAIRAAHEGRPTLSSEAVQALVQTPEKEPDLGGDLTGRELEVLAGLVEGRSNAEIAEELIVSVAAVKYHVSSILSKLRASNRTEAALLAVEHNLVSRG